MTRIKIKRAYEKPEPDDGFRVFVDRLWPRGMRKEDFRYDLWTKQIAPSAALRRWYHEDMPGRWEEFGRRYTAELRQSPAVAEFVRQIAGNDTVTLVYASRNALQNHALILQDYLVKIMSVMTV
ncbi:DUF488 domain-containing protein [Candidatus Alistipes pullistercoris]|uniref:DUF488 domain-containing protein n=1 Tax=Candidatus Alistipes pullistercoris TaxID=2838446 RepID=UPI0022E18309|nr:DUF488 family protein [Candidatus Alistipes pullistercoris]